MLSRISNDPGEPHEPEKYDDCGQVFEKGEVCEQGCCGPERPACVGDVRGAVLNCAFDRRQKKPLAVEHGPVLLPPVQLGDGDENQRGPAGGPEQAAGDPDLQPPVGAGHLHAGPDLPAEMRGDRQEAAEVPALPRVVHERQRHLLPRPVQPGVRHQHLEPCLEPAEGGQGRSVHVSGGHPVLLGHAGAAALQKGCLPPGRAGADPHHPLGRLQHLQPVLAQAVQLQQGGDRHQGAGPYSYRRSHQGRCSSVDRGGVCQDERGCPGVGYE